MSKLSTSALVFMNIIMVLIVIAESSEAKSAPRRSTIKKAKSLVSKLTPNIKATNLNDFLSGTGEVFEKVSESVRWFKKLQDQMKRRNVTTITMSEKDRLLDEIKICKPTDINAKCYSKCMIRGGYSYLWCHTTSNLDDWSVCQCQIRPDVLEFLQMTRDNFLATTPKPTLTNPEIALISTLSGLGTITVVAGLVIAYWYHKQRNIQQARILGHGGRVIENPIYRMPNEPEVL